MSNNHNEPRVYLNGKPYDFSEFYAPDEAKGWLTEEPTSKSAGDTEPRVERTLEYKVKSEDINAGKEVCVEKRFDGLFSPLPACDKDKTEGKLIKTRTVIHIPAGSFDKLVTVTSE